MSASAAWLPKHQSGAATPIFSIAGGSPGLKHMSMHALGLGRAVLTHTQGSAPTHSGDTGDMKARGGRRPAPREPRSAAITPSAAVLLISAVHAVRISVAAPAHGDAVPILALELVELAARCAVLLQGKGEGQRSAGTALAVAASHPVTAPRTRLSAPAWWWGTTGRGRLGGTCPHSHMWAGQRCWQGAPALGTIPRQSRLHSHGPHRTSTCRQCSGHWHTRTRSPSRAGALGTENTGRPPERRLQAGLREQKVSLANSLGGTG